MIIKKPRITKADKKRGVNATKRVEKIRIKALRKHHVNLQTLKDIEKANPDRPLTEKQRLFVRFWAQGETIRTASVLAGYNDGATMAWKMSKDPAILKLYREEKKLYEEASQMTRKRVMDMLQEAYDCAKLVSEPASMVAAAREIGKMCGYYEPEVKIVKHIDGTLMDRLSTMSDDELLTLLEENGDTIIGEARRVVDEVPLLEANASQE